MIFRAHLGECRWEGTPVLEYKQDGTTTFRHVTRQTLFEGEGMEFQWRYFEVAPGGYSTLERHEHEHAVMVVRGEGRVLVGDAVHDIRLYDLILVPPMTWHQFQPAGDEPLGFLCIVNARRDRPQLPTAADLEALRRNPEVAAFIRV
ncbi:cupin domain-containing protein [Caldilinea sp.]|jgi:quercetin dioxygenase-like cupin family protein|uniref:cupin domain-containing protein n=1 Tax=Caldilinea sp. TaxID=2293560 RepID=UPI0021DB9606|nr:cupin domain-containing protein [Caldilinea sp.]GIV69272.1 MAG: cupin [Caldilinea sp.]